jgi:AAA family ATP:ADP antiporter
VNRSRRAHLTGLLRSVLPVRSGEWWTFLLLGSVLFGIQVIDGAIDVISVSAFVGNVGVEQVPSLALMQGVTLLLLSNVSTLLVDRWPKARLLPVLLLVYGLLLCAIRGLIAWGQIPFAIYALLYLVRWQMFFLLGIVFWAIVTDTFALASANRLVPRIGAAGFLGTILGNKLGGESGHLLVSQGFPSADVLLITGVLLGIGAWGVSKLDLPASGSSLTNRPLRAGDHAQSLRDVLWQAPRFVRNVRIFRLLTIVVFISSIGFVLVLFEFLSRSKAAYTNNLDFQAFYGNVQAVVQVVIFLLQLGVSNRLFSRWGAASAPLGLPLVLIPGGLLFGFVPGLWVGILVMYASDVNFLVFERPAIDVLFTLVPAQMKGRVKTLLDTVVRPAGYIVGGGVLLLLIRLVSEGWLRDAQLGFALGMLLLLLGLISLVTAAALVGNYATYLQDWQLARRRRHIPDVVD